MDYDRLRELQQKFEENPRRYFAPLANEYRKGGQPRRAIEICRVHLEQMPGHMSGQIVYGQALYEAGDFAEARQVFERALSLDPENLIALRSLGDMSLQAGNPAEARSWYSRLLDADPKDTSVIALISEIDAASEAKPVPAQVPGIDTDVGDQQIPAGLESGAEAEPIPEPSLLDASDLESTSAPAEQGPPLTDDYPPLGLERHYPVPEPTVETQAEESVAPEGPTLEDLGVPAGASAAEGLTSAREDINSALDSRGEDLETTEPANASSADTSMQAPEADTTMRDPEAEAADALQLAEVSESVESFESATSEPAVAEDRGEPEPAPPTIEAEQAEPAPVRPAPTEERPPRVASPEPFVNETMAKLYLKQGYNQLALKVYRQLLVARPDDNALRDRIREIQEADAAQHPGEAVVSRRAEPPVGRTEESQPTNEPSEEASVEPQAPRSPSIEAPTPEHERDDGFNFGRSPVDSPLDDEPARQRESVEAPTRDEPRAEPAGIAARQPSVREFFATLGRRRPPRASFDATPQPLARQSVEPPADTTPPYGTDTSQPFGASGPGATLDSVFAGATVSPADARAASRLAGAFSGAGGAARTPPTPPMPTPRLNPRVQAQESEEDVAKFRAWLDGLTGE